jgi:hypothetical protein
MDESIPTDSQFNPYECPYCHGPKTYGARYCMKCHVITIDKYRVAASQRYPCK